jgi:hypothetical protein
MIAALYVDAKGPYVGMDGVDVWTIDRDAKTYGGPGPGVFHPDCGPWGRLHHMCTKQDRTCGPIAVAQVRAYKGVLEHPSDSKLWAHCGMSLPGELPDQWGGYTIAVRQCDWGHKAAKPTWLYIVGVPREAVDERRPARAPTHKVTNNDRPGMAGLKRLTGLECRATPPEFAEWLVSIARSAR